MDYNDKIFIETIKYLVMSSNYPFYCKQNIICEIDNYVFAKDFMDTNNYYRNFIWYIVKELLVRAGIIPFYHN